MQRLDVRLRRFITFSFPCDRMDKDRSMKVFDVIEDSDELAHIVSIDGTEVTETESFKQHSGCDDDLDAFLHAGTDLTYPVADRIEFSGEIPNVRLESI